jgi:biopolymer transport protein ExbD
VCSGAQASFDRALPHTLGRGTDILVGWHSKRGPILACTLTPRRLLRQTRVLNGTRFLSAYQPEFNIETDRDFPDTLLVLSTWIAALALATGLMLVLRRALVSRQEKLAEEKSFTAPPTGSYPSEMLSRRVRSRGDTRQSLWQTYSNWAVHIVFVLLLPFVVMFVLSSLRLTPYGIWVKLLQQSSQVDQKQSTTVKVVLQIACDKAEPEYAIGEHVFASNDLPDQLKHALAPLPDWTVYVDGDSNCPLNYVGSAIDAARGLRARVVLVTPASRKLIQLDSGSPVTVKSPMNPPALRPPNDKANW